MTLVVADDALLDRLETLTREAGAAILAVADAQRSRQDKADGSPVTEADLAADAVIRRALADAYPGVPVVTEESGVPEDLDEDADYFLVDPLDGTKEYLAGRPEYTVNVALIRGRRPVAGVVGIPAAGTVYAGLVTPKTAWKTYPDGHRQVLTPAAEFRGRLAVSRSHRTADEAQFAQQHGFITLVEAGSSLKGCLVAEGSADAYVRFGNVHSWDIAAMDAVVTAAGVPMVSLGDHAPLRYGLRPTLVTGGFLVGSRGG